MKVILSAGIANLCNCPQVIEFSNISNPKIAIDELRNSYPLMQNILPLNGDIPKYLLFIFDGNQIDYSKLPTTSTPDSVLRILNAVAGG